MDEIGPLAAVLIDKLRSAWSGTTAATVTALALFQLAVVAYEAATRRDTRRYLTRHFRTDAAYAAFYVSGIYAVFVWGPIFRLLEGLVRDRAPFLEARALAGAPFALHFAAFLVLTDFLGYWKHRLMHAVPALWAFHSVHHSQERLTYLTAYRFHFVDELANNLLFFLPGVLLGVPSAVWLPLTVVLTFYQSLQHSDLDWSYGRLDAVLVSPRYHSVHHAPQRAVHDRNFGLFFSLWDGLFGTRDPAPRRPPAYGVADTAMPESFLAQVAAPFRALFSRRP